MFTVVEGEGRTFWAAGDGTSTYYKGQLVSYTYAGKANTPGTVVPLAVSAGIWDITNNQVIAGVVTGFNLRTPRTTTVGSILTEYDGGTVTTQAQQLARDFTGAEGMYGKADPQVLMQIAEILPNTVVRGPFYKSAYGTAVGVSTVTASTDTTGITAASLTGISFDAAPIANSSTIYCRTGANAGIYRVNLAASATAPTVTTAFPYDIGVGDTFLCVPAKQGHSSVVIAGPGLYIDSASASVLNGTARFQLIVYKLDLSVSGKEYADFRFGTQHFAMADKAVA